MTRLERLLNKFFRQDDGADEGAPVPARAIVKQFTLKLGSREVGKLRYGNGQWSFEYADAYRAAARAGEVRPVIGFPDVERLYTSPTLWPFFLVRLPGKYINREPGGEDLTEVELLERYGRRTSVNPYELAVAE